MKIERMIELDEKKSIRHRYWLFMYGFYDGGGGLSDISATSDEEDEILKIYEEFHDEYHGWNNHEIYVFDSVERVYIIDNTENDEKTEEQK